MILRLRRLIALRPRGGYNLLEVLIGMVVLAIALASAFALSVANARLVERNQNLAAAVNLAEAKLEELRNLPYASVVDGSDDGTINAQGDPDGIFSRAWTVANGVPGFATSELKTVVVTVQWSQWGETRGYSLTGVIGQ